VTQGDLLNQIFREPFETSIMVFDDYTYVTWSNHLEGSIFGGASERIEYLESIGLSLNHVVAFIHNHPTPAGPSSSDLDFLHDLRRHGYKRLYGIYYPFGKKLLWVEQ
jgi:hypothetical protein